MFLAHTLSPERKKLLKSEYTGTLEITAPSGLT